MLSTVVTFFSLLFLFPFHIELSIKCKECDVKLRYLGTAVLRERFDARARVFAGGKRDRGGERESEEGVEATEGGEFPTRSLNGNSTSVEGSKERLELPS